MFSHITLKHNIDTPWTWNLSSLKTLPEMSFRDLIPSQWNYFIHFIFIFLFAPFYFGWKIHKKRKPTNLVVYSMESYRKFLINIPIIQSITSTSCQWQQKFCRVKLPCLHTVMFPVDFTLNFICFFHKIITSRLVQWIPVTLKCATCNETTTFWLWSVRLGSANSQGIALLSEEMVSGPCLTLGSFSRRHFLSWGKGRLCTWPMDSWAAAGNPHGWLPWSPHTSQKWVLRDPKPEKSAGTRSAGITCELPGFLDLFPVIPQY